jgi:hypothetical protein
MYPRFLQQHNNIATMAETKQTLSDKVSALEQQLRDLRADEVKRLRKRVAELGLQPDELFGRARAARKTVGSAESPAPAPKTGAGATKTPAARKAAVKSVPAGKKAAAKKAPAAKRAAAKKASSSEHSQPTPAGGDAAPTEDNVSA